MGSYHVTGNFANFSTITKWYDCLHIYMHISILDDIKKNLRNITEQNKEKNLKEIL